MNLNSLYKMSPKALTAMETMTNDQLSNVAEQSAKDHNLTEIEAIELFYKLREIRNERVRFIKQYPPWFQGFIRWMNDLF